MVAEEGWGFIGLVGSTQVELVVAEQEAEHDHKNLNSEVNFDSTCKPSTRQQG